MVGFGGGKHSARFCQREARTSEAGMSKHSGVRLNAYASITLACVNLGQNLGNEGLIFHEALHGFAGLGDDELLRRLAKHGYDENRTIDATSEAWEARNCKDEWLRCCVASATPAILGECDY
jgi:hypothetical protein